MKMYKKADLSVLNGMLVAPNGEVIVPDPKIVKQANALETLSQKVAYLMTQPSATPAPSLDDFERLSIKDKVIEGARFEATTPILDLKARESMAIMNEIDDVNTVRKANDLLAEFSDLLEFVDGDYVVDFGGSVIPFDMPVLGSVLDLTQKDITKVIAMASGLRDDDDREECDDYGCVLHPEMVKRDKDGDIIKHKRLPIERLSDEDAATLIGIIEKYDAEAEEIDPDKVDSEEEDADAEAEQE